MKIGKTEREFRNALNVHLPDLPGDYAKIHIANSLISALDLEFQEPEGRKITNLDLELRTNDGLRIEAARRHNAFPDLLALARELVARLCAYRYGQGDLGNEPTSALIDRAHALLDRLEARP